MLNPRRLKTQSEGIDANNWNISRNEPKGSILIMRIDDNSLRQLAKKEYKLFLGFTTLTFRVLEPKSKVLRVIQINLQDKKVATAGFFKTCEVKSIDMALIQEPLIKE